LQGPLLYLLIGLVLLAASFTQSLSGFGSALISMPILVEMLGIQVAAPLVALVGITIELVLLVRYRFAVNIHVVRRLVLASLAGIPLGVWALGHVEEQWALNILGGVVLAYAAYALLGLNLPKLRHPGWTLFFGFLAGLLGGAYNTAGPPVIIYGHCRRWTSDSFKANLQGFFLIVSAWVAVSHGFNHNLTPIVWRSYVCGLIPIGLGLWLGLRLDPHLDPALFRRIVLWVLVFLGIRLIF
jgi:hypothetical protein